MNPEIKFKNSQEFLDIAAKVKKINNTIKISDQLHLYGLYKQAVIGDVNTIIPSIFEVIKRKKWVSWNFFKGMSNSSAESAYINYYLNLP